MNRNRNRNVAFSGKRSECMRARSITRKITNRAGRKRGANLRRELIKADLSLRLLFHRDTPTFTSTVQLRVRPTINAINIDERDGKPAETQNPERELRGRGDLRVLHAWIPRRKRRRTCTLEKERKRGRESARVRASVQGWVSATATIRQR